MLVSIVTLNYKKKELTIAAMASLWEHYKEYFLKNDIELIVVDNASEDGSVEAFKNEIKAKKYTNVHLLVNSKNTGFGAGCNLGEKNALGKYILFLNNDTVVEDNSIIEMAEYMQKHENVSILGGQLRNSDGSLQSSYGKFYTLFNAFILLYGKNVAEHTLSHVTKVDWVKGALLMIHKDTFDQLGGFDEGIFMYMEDMELCYRAKEAGFDTYFYPHVRVVHAEHGSANRSFAIIHIYKNLLYFYKKHRSISEYHMLKFLLISKAICLIALGSITGNTYLRTTYKDALSQIS